MSEPALTHAPFWKRAGNEDMSGFRMTKAEQMKGYRGGGHRATYRSIAAWKAAASPSRKVPCTRTACGLHKSINTMVDAGWTCPECALATVAKTEIPYSDYDAAFFAGKPAPPIEGKRKGGER